MFWIVVTVFLCCVSILPLVGILLACWAVSVGEAPTWVHAIGGGVTFGACMVAAEGLIDGIDQHGAAVTMAGAIVGSVVLRVAYLLHQRRAA